MPESPKQRLLKNKPLAELIGRILHSHEFEIAGDVALLQFHENQNRMADIQSAQAAHYETVGAKRFLQLLQTITDETPTAKRETPGQLDHGVK